MSKSRKMRDAERRAKKTRAARLLATETKWVVGAGNDRKGVGKKQRPGCSRRSKKQRAHFSRLNRLSKRSS